jgi:hypothetical protein
MPRMYELYIVDEAKLPIDPVGTDQDRHRRLVEAVRQHGARWAQIESQELPFMEALERIDREALGGHRFLPVLAYNNSPQNVLGNDPASPDFGYFDPEKARDLHTVFERTPADVMAAFEADPLLESVYWSFRDAAKEAAPRGHAIAVLHAG